MQAQCSTRGLELEELNRETQARRVQVEVRQVDNYPQFSVIER